MQKKLLQEENWNQIHPYPCLNLFQSSPKELFSGKFSFLQWLTKPKPEIFLSTRYCSSRAYTSLFSVLSSGDIQSNSSYRVPHWSSNGPLMFPQCSPSSSVVPQWFPRCSSVVPHWPPSGPQRFHIPPMVPHGIPQFMQYCGQVILVLIF